MIWLPPLLSPNTGEVTIVATVVDDEAARTNATDPGLSGTVINEIGDAVLEESEELGVNITVESVERFGE